MRHNFERMPQPLANNGGALVGRDLMKTLGVASAVVGAIAVAYVVTNKKGDLDSGFLRRLRFPFPKATT